MKQYELSPRTAATLDKAFLSHPPQQDQLQRLEAINEKMRQACQWLCKTTPESAEQTLMIRSMQEAMFWAEEAIKKNEVGA